MTEQALVIAGHGSHRNPDSAAPVRVAVEAARERGAFAEVRPAFWKEAPSIRDVWHTIDADEAIVVPLFVSEGYFVEQVIPRELDLGKHDRGEDAPTLEYADPVGTHPAMTDVIAARAKRLIDSGSPDVDTEDTALAVIGHGTERNTNSADAIYNHVEALREQGEFAEVGALFMDEAPYVDGVLDEFSADEIAVVPLFIADGFHTQDEIPELLGLTDEPRADYPVPGTVEDRRIWYSSAVGTDPLVVDVVFERAAEAGANIDNSADVSRPVREQAGDAFVSWVESAEADEEEESVTPNSSTRIWGELAVTATGAGSYDLRHRSDRKVAVTDLDQRSVGDLHEVVRYAEDGRYRPFAGESTLPTGWVLSDLDRDGLLAAAATVYPASVEHWAVEREGDLDPVDFRAVADRQTGIYECVADCSQAEVAGAVEACCGNCEKKRAWSHEGETDESGSEDEGAIPCREPCSFLVASAREFHQHEGESTTDHPTESDASVPRGDTTDPENVYRVRYRRARDAERLPPQP